MGLEHYKLTNQNDLLKFEFTSEGIKGSIRKAIIFTNSNTFISHRYF
jgi:hypothetical protein